MYKVDYIISKFEDIICSLGLLGATFLMFINVILRYIFNYGLPWSEEVVRYAILSVTFIGISLCARRDSHVAIDILFVLMKNKLIKFILHLIINIISIIFCFLMFRYSIMLVQQVARYNQVSPALGIPFYLLYLSMPIGFGLSALRFMQKTVKLIKEKILEI